MGLLAHVKPGLLTYFRFLVKKWVENCPLFYGVRAGDLQKSQKSKVVNSKVAKVVSIFESRKSRKRQNN